jgi:hypothetical protein
MASTYVSVYVPGVVTTVAVNLPVMTYLVVRGLREDYVSPRWFIASSLCVLVGVSFLVGLGETALGAMFS